MSLPLPIGMSSSLLHTLLQQPSYILVAFAAISTSLLLYVKNILLGSSPADKDGNAIPPGPWGLPVLGLSFRIIQPVISQTPYLCVYRVFPVPFPKPCPSSQ